MDWIDVKERLPEPFESVLAVTPEEYRVAYYNEEEFVCEALDCRLIGVTHWMHLSQPPQQPAT